MPDGTPVPRLIAASADPPALMMTDAGTGPSLATALLGSDPAQATAATVHFAEALAALHLATQNAHETFAAELAARSAGTVPPALMPAWWPAPPEPSIATAPSSASPSRPPP